MVCTTSPWQSHNVFPAQLSICMEVIPRRDMHSTNLGSQERVSSLPIPVPAETSTPTSITNGNYQEPYITTEWVPLAGTAGGARGFLSDPDFNEAQARLACPLPRWSPRLLYTRPLVTPVTGRGRCSCSAKIEEDLAEKREGWWYFSELGSLSLPLPFYLLPRFFDPLCATWDHNPFSTPLALSKQDRSFEMFSQGVL